MLMNTVYVYIPVYKRTRGSYTCVYMYMCRYIWSAYIAYSAVIIDDVIPI